MANAFSSDFRASDAHFTRRDHRLLSQESEELDDGIPRTPKQVLPPQTHIAQVLRAAIHDNDTAVAESQENLSLALGTRFRRPGREDVRDDRTRARLLLLQIAKQIERVNPVQMHALRERFPDLLATPNLLAFLRRSGMSSGMSALMLAAWLNHGGLTAAQRRHLQRTLDEATRTEGWALEVFGELECGGPVTGELGRQLATLYRQASCRERSLAQWFEACRQMPDRHQRLRALLRTLGFELGARGIEADVPRLAAVIEDIRRVLLFLTLTSQCEAAAAMLGLPRVDGDTIVTEMLAMLDQPWMNVGWLAQRTSKLGLTENAHAYALTRELTSLTQWTHEACFRDADQRAMLLDVLEARRSALVEASEASD